MGQKGKETEPRGSTGSGDRAKGNTGKEGRDRGGGGGTFVDVVLGEAELVVTVVHGEEAALVSLSDDLVLLVSTVAGGRRTRCSNYISNGPDAGNQRENW